MKERPKDLISQLIGFISGSKKKIHLVKWWNSYVGRHARFPGNPVTDRLHGIEVSGKIAQEWAINIDIACQIRWQRVRLPGKAVTGEDGRERDRGRGEVKCTQAACHCSYKILPAWPIKSQMASILKIETSSVDANSWTHCNVNPLAHWPIQSILLPS